VLFPVIEAFKKDDLGFMKANHRFGSEPQADAQVTSKGSDKTAMSEEDVESNADKKQPKIVNSRSCLDWRFR
jgi:hypothetical protein